MIHWSTSSEAIEQREARLEAEVAARLSEETNRNLFILSVVTVIFLPMTLITGIFGMNLAGLRPARGPQRVLVGNAADGRGAGRISAGNPRARALVS